MKTEYIKCNLCNLDITRFMGKRRNPTREQDRETNIVQCSICGLMYPNPMPRFEMSEIQNNFGSPEGYFFQNVTDKRIEKYEKIMDIIEAVKPKKGDLLDIGCGRGELVHIAKRRHWHAIGTEMSKSFALYAKDKFGIDVLVGEIEKMNFLEESFDVAILNSVIQYVQDPLGTLKRISLLLRKDGILYIEVTNEDALVFKAGDFFMNVTKKNKVTTHLSPLFPSFQIYGFNKSSLSESLRKSGFKIYTFSIRGITGGGKIKGCGLCFSVIRFIRKIIIAIGGLMGKGHLIYCLAKKR